MADGDPLRAFHPTIRRWFRERLGEPTPPQVRGWPRISAGRHGLIAAPTGSGKTLAAFLSALDSLLKEGAPEAEGGDRLALPDETRVLYVSPLRALSNDVQKNLAGPLAELRGMDPALPEVRVLVRTGDTPQRERQKMVKRPPHVLVTTPESLYLLLTTGGGRRMLAAVRTVIVDEVHALVGDKRGSHLALSLERLVALAGEFQRIGLSATQKPIEVTARFVCGVGRDCDVVDVGHYRKMDLAVEIPPSPLSTICSHEVWGEIYQRVAQLIREHKTTLVFVNTRKLAERIAAQLTKLLGEEKVGCHHSSLSRERRLDAEQRLKAGKLKALVATASLELGIDIGDVDLAIQIGSTRAISTFLQRVGRSGHVLRKTPKGRLFPVTIDELCEAAALLRAVRAAELDATRAPSAPLDILAQQVVAACAACAWSETGLYEAIRRAWPYGDLSREDFDRVVKLHVAGRHALLHRDGVNGRLLATKRARLTALQSGGAIPDNADWQVLLEPEGTFVGTVHEDFAIESDHGDVFQLGNASWRIVRQERGTLRVVDAKGAPPTLPFWIAEAPGRTRELSAALGELREAIAREPRRDTAEAWLVEDCLVPRAAAEQIVEHVRAGLATLGAAPTQRRMIAERFFDESGGMQLVLHAPFGSRINRALGLALRKSFCRGFGFELQAAANEDAIVISLGTQHSFPLEEVFDYLRPESARALLEQAVLAQPMFTTRWRWNLTRSLLLERMKDGRRVPAPLQRMRADDRLAAAFPAAVACGETLPAGDLPIPWEHPIVRQTMEDCLREALDVDGFLEVLEGLKRGAIERVAVDSVEPSAFARSVLAIKPYGFLDDAPLEERRTQAVMSRRALPRAERDEIGALDAAAVARVKQEAWPAPESAEELHEALTWMGYVTAEEAEPWRKWIDELAAAGRVVLEGDRWFAADSTRDPKEILRGRLEALGPIPAATREETALLYALEQEGAVLRTRLDGKTAWCERRLLARIHRYTIETLRREIEPASVADYLRYLARWQHVEESAKVEGPQGLRTIVEQLAGFEAPAALWEAKVLPRRMRAFRREWLDQLALTGELAWGRLWGGGGAPIKITPICLLPRAELAQWLAIAEPPAREGLSGAASDLLAALDRGGAMFPPDLKKEARLLDSHFETGLQELIARGAVTCDSFAALRQFIVPPSRRKLPVLTVGRWSRFRPAAPAPDPDAPGPERQAGIGRVPSVWHRGLAGAGPGMVEAGHAAGHGAEFVGKALLRRYGVLFRRVIARERAPVPWRDLVRWCRTLELRGELRGGRFVAGVDGEQYALPEAVAMLRAARRDARSGGVEPVDAAPLSPADPLAVAAQLIAGDRSAPAEPRPATA